MNNVEPPRDTRSFGEVRFNYTNHDGRFQIGAESWIFETRWSSAGRGSAHLYNDPPGIMGVAIAEGVATIGQVTPDVVAFADFTSRVRTPHVGQIALLRNEGGFYAAIEPLEINYSSLPSGNLMRLRFAILTDRSTDFSMFATRFNDQQALVDQLLSAAKDAEYALRAIPASNEIGDVKAVGIGHNQPPAQFAINDGDRVRTQEAIATVQQEAASTNPSTSRLRASGQVIAQFAGKVARWISRKLDNAVDEFSKTVGKASAVAIIGGGVSYTAWIALQDKLTILLDILKQFVG